MSFRSPFRSPFSSLAFAALVVSGLAVIHQASDRATKRPQVPAECPGLRTDECPGVTDPEEITETREPQKAVLRAAEVCVDVGYLCAEVETKGSVRLRRWPGETTLIRIWVPEPDGLSPEQARELQRASVRGIQAWHGHPVPLSIRTRENGAPPDITVEWARTIEDGRLGKAGVEWTEGGGVVQFRVIGLVLATHEPTDSPTELNPKQVELVAAHEMGHALGLPHSDDPRDVMFPENTATRLTNRDYRTLAALYSLPNGAEIRR